MQKPQKRTIALVVAGLIVGTQAGIAAISEQGADAAQTPAAETSAVQPQVEATTQPEIVAQAPDAAAPSTPAVSEAVEKYVAIPYTSMRLKVTSTTFPSAAVENPPLPGMAEYFDRLNNNRVLTGAAGSVFPTTVEDQVSPMTVAYFDRVEAQRMAASRPAPAVAAAPAPVMESPSAASAPAADAQVNTLQSSAPSAEQRPGS